MSDKKTKHTVQEEIEVTGGEVASRVKDIIQQGNIRRIIVRRPDETVLFDISLTTGIIAGGALMYFAAPVAILGVAAALIAKVKVEITREVQEGEQVRGTAEPVLTSHKQVKITVEDEDDVQIATDTAQSAVDRAEDAVNKLKVDTEPPQDD